MKTKKALRAGFSLMEIIVYVAIFTLSAAFFVAILSSITRVNSRQASFLEVNQQTEFVLSTIRQAVQNSAYIDLENTTASTTLRLRMESSSIDPTLIYYDETEKTIFMKEGSGSVAALTDDKVIVDSFLVRKNETLGGKSTIEVSIGMTYNAEADQAKFAKTAKTTVARISVVTLDSHLLPTENGTLEFGTSSYRWKDAYFAGSIAGGGLVRVGATSSKSSFISSGDVYVSDSSYGIVFKDVNGNCRRITVSSIGELVISSTISCPTE